jgi:nitroreductase
VEFKIIQQAMAVAALSPSACNRQAFKFLFYNEKNIVGEIIKTPGGYVGFDAPSVVIVIGSYRGYFHERDANVPIIDASLAVMAFILALETLGLSSVCVNWPCLPDQDEAIRRLIHLEEDEFITLLIVVGYAEPQGKVPYSAKRDINTLVFCNERIIGKPSLVDSSDRY